MSRGSGRAAVVALAGCLLPGVARAHLVGSGLGSFYDGLAHFLLTPDQVLPVLALMLLAGRNGDRTGRLALFTLPLAWLAGGLVGLASPTLRVPSMVSTAPLLVLGVLVAAGARLQTASVVALAAGLGLFHGALNGSAMFEARLGASGLSGTLVALCVLAALAAGLAVSLRAAWQQVALRVAGSWVAAIGLLSIGWSLRGGLP